MHRRQKYYQSTEEEQKLEALDESLDKTYIRYKIKNSVQKSKLIAIVAIVLLLPSYL